MLFIMALTPQYLNQVVRLIVLKLTEVYKTGVRFHNHSFVAEMFSILIKNSDEQLNAFENQIISQLADNTTCLRKC